MEDGRLFSALEEDELFRDPDESRGQTDEYFPDPDGKTYRRSINFLLNVVYQYERCVTQHSFARVVFQGSVLTLEQDLPVAIRMCTDKCLRCCVCTADLNLWCGCCKHVRPKLCEHLPTKLSLKISDENMAFFLTRNTNLHVHLFKASSSHRLFEYLLRTLNFLLSHYPDRFSVLGRYPAYLAGVLEEPPQLIEVFTVTSNLHFDPLSGQFWMKDVGTVTYKSYDRYFWALLLILDAMGGPIKTGVVRDVIASLRGQPVMVKEVGHVRYIFLCCGDNPDETVFSEFKKFSARLPSALKWEIKESKLGGLFLRPARRTATTNGPLVTLRRPTNRHSYVCRYNVPTSLSTQCLLAIELCYNGGHGHVLHDHILSEMYRFIWK